MAEISRHKLRVCGRAIPGRYDAADDCSDLSRGRNREPHQRAKSSNEGARTIERMLNNKKGIIFGVANKRSIAWATAQALHEAGAQLAFAYQGERLKENVEGLTHEAMPGALLLPCDVTRQEEVDQTFKQVNEEFGRLDFLIHSIAFAPRE